MNSWIGGGNDGSELFDAGNEMSILHDYSILFEVRREMGLTTQDNVVATASRSVNFTWNLSAVSTLLV
jgi:hypothetical protein